MKCMSCGFENEENASFCKRCGVNLKKDDIESFNENIEVLNEEFKVDKKRKPYTPQKNSLTAKLIYKPDRRTGKLRIAKTKTATLIVFFGFMGFSLIVYSLTTPFYIAIFASILFGLVFAIPVAIIGFVLGRILDKIFP